MLPETVRVVEAPDPGGEDGGALVAVAGRDPTWST